MKKLSTFLFSMLTSTCLLLVFAIAIAYATFIENDYGTQTAQILIYSATWFEILLLLTAVNLIGGLFYYKAFKLKRWSMVLFHLAFVVILLGAAITRFFSYEGTMHIREGEASNQLVTRQSYIQLTATDEQGQVSREEWPVELSPYAHLNFDHSFSLGSRELTLELLDFIPGGEAQIVADETGSPAVELIVLDGGIRKTVTLAQHETVALSDFHLSFEGSPGEHSILVKRSGPGLLVQANDSLSVLNMNGSVGDLVAPGDTYALSTQNMFQVGDVLFVLRRYLPNARKVLVASRSENVVNLPDGLLGRITQGATSNDFILTGQQGAVNTADVLIMNDVRYEINYGSKIVELPFSLQLNDFQLERYPGSMSPSSFASEVTVLDKTNQVEMPFRIYMNNILDYGGYRFFQSSYDQDEKGTILSVSFDRLGTRITYLGYLLMTIGMLASFFNGKSRFRFLLRAASRVKAMKRKSLPVALMLLMFVPNVANAGTGNLKIDKSHLSLFDQLLVQDRQGRIEPVNTLASEVLRKLTRQSTFEGLSATEVFMGMSAMPEYWKNEPIIKISNGELAKKLNVKGKYASFNQLVDLGKGSYLLRTLVDQAYKKTPNNRSKFDKEIIQVDERVNICYQVYSGAFMKVFPDSADANKTWFTEAELLAQTGTFAPPLMSQYLENLQQGMKNGHFQAADKALHKLIDFQREQGAELILPAAKVKLEILYNKLNVFGWLSKICALIGLVLLLVHLTTIFSSRYRVTGLLKAGNWLIFLVFLVYTAGLAVRWYISGHAPWSNSYETLLYVGWATLLSGFVFLKKSQITLAVTSILAALILMVAGMSWLNPEITNLVPVLKSYWLIVHVAVITASYGFLGIAALLGILNLLLMIFRNQRNLKSASYTIVEIAIVIELSLIVGLILLTIGAFIGGVWANESWGRYWGWDPKETWALVTILVYSLIIHLRKVPGIYSNYVLSFLAVIGFSSVLMTFFGVNYYLSGMHSYGQGDPPPVPSGIYLAILAILLIGGFAAASERKFGKAEKLVRVDE
ncbi:cytochrome c biogenesis protein CcsA [Mangrovibacterium marinum]|uniref:Cytochrome c-type biogenesis protein CcsB n=1 Tax=Mangrovibacterium marinum TaxID=1639118 RepID=A0A2T5BZM3_9BACT|nr:cytochrome c biogenesis protein CcsA [Mangrovibacterium marinum]PTN07737.1 cytochrome c-type biogenesis protein CcsB [Mangrovibacterium marinum]